MLESWRPSGPLNQFSPENLVWADLETPRPLPDREEQCKTIGQAQPYRLQTAGP